MADEKNPVGEALKKLPGNIVGGPVDFLNLAAGALSGKGLSGLVDKPFGGSEHINKLLGQNEGSSGTGEDLASLALSLANPTAATKSAVIASAALATKLSQGKKLAGATEAAMKIPDMAKKADALTKTTTEAAMIPALLAGGSESKFGQKVAESGKTPKEVLKEVRKKKAEGASVEDIYKEFGVVQSPGTKKWDAVILNPELDVNLESGKLRLGLGYESMDEMSNPPQPVLQNEASFSDKAAAVLGDYLTGLEPSVAKHTKDISVRSGSLMDKGDASFNSEDRTVRFNSSDAGDLPALLSHEIQHALDDKFKRPSGGNPGLFESEEFKATKKLAEGLEDMFPGFNWKDGKKQYSDAMWEIIQANSKQFLAARDAFYRYSYDQYRGLAGEVKASAVQNLTLSGDEAKFLEDIQNPISTTALKYSDLEKMALDQKYKTDLANELKLIETYKDFYMPPPK